MRARSPPLEHAGPGVLALLLMPAVGLVQVPTPAATAPTPTPAPTPPMGRGPAPPLVNKSTPIRGRGVVESLQLGQAGHGIGTAWGGVGVGTGYGAGISILLLLRWWEHGPARGVLVLLNGKNVAAKFHRRSVLAYVHSDHSH